MENTKMLKIEKVLQMSEEIKVLIKNAGLRREIIKNMISRIEDNSFQKNEILQEIKKQYSELEIFGEMFEQIGITLHYFLEVEKNLKKELNKEKLELLLKFKEEIQNKIIMEENNWINFSNEEIELFKKIDKLAKLH